VREWSINNGFLSTQKNKDKMSLLFSHFLSISFKRIIFRKQTGVVDDLWRVVQRREELGQLISISVDEYFSLSGNDKYILLQRGKSIPLTKMFLFIRFATTARL
jgi:hypothetical protein